MFHKNNISWKYIVLTQCCRKVSQITCVSLLIVCCSVLLVSPAKVSFAVLFANVWVQSLMLSTRAKLLLCDLSNMSQMRVTSPTYLTVSGECSRSVHICNKQLLCNLRIRSQMSGESSRSVNTTATYTLFCDLSSRFQISGVLHFCTHLQYTLWCVNSVSGPKCAESAPVLYTTATYTLLYGLSSRFQFSGEC